MKNCIVKRYFYFLFGLVINSFGIVLITKGGLGTSPISSIPYVFSLIFPSITFGQTTFLLNIGFILIQWVLLRKNFQPIQFLQIVATFIFSAFIDLSMMLTTWLVPSTLISQLVVTILGCMILAFGITVEVAPQVITVPGEGVVKVISQVFHIDFDRVKNCFDLTLMLIALIVSLSSFHALRGLGIGTILAAILVGRFVAFYSHHFTYSQKIMALAHD